MAYFAHPRNSEATRALARDHMRKLHARPRSLQEIEAALQTHRAADAEENELLVRGFPCLLQAHVHPVRCHRKKFVKKYGHDAFMEFYFPKYEELGTRFLPRVQFDEGPAAKKRKNRRHSSHMENSSEGSGASK
ncbi:hypothetical protein FB451DRAFT_1405104 [Mycena latifolia]|nr:hypothetical protein FB451DRAFT_1405104 [Mycena latifolia]